METLNEYKNDKQHGSFLEICKVGKNYKIVDDMRMGGKYPVLVGQGKMHDFTSKEREEIMRTGEVEKIKIEPSELEELKRFLS
ncbi:MAG: hypothetical protein NTY20_03270 [Candidatus Aenigmarchaeota archaeon]|nr:hypothetical protein [Candidatus Aenigmarchaeota archaeon]